MVTSMSRSWCHIKESVHDNSRRRQGNRSIWVLPPGGSPGPADGLCCTREPACRARQQSLTCSCLSSADVPSCVTAGCPDVPSARDRKERCCPVSKGPSGRDAGAGAQPQGLAPTCPEASRSVSSRGCGRGTELPGPLPELQDNVYFFQPGEFPWQPSESVTHHFQLFHLAVPPQF